MQGFIQGVVGGALAPLEKPLTQRMKRCDLVPAPFKNLHIPDCPPCMQILYEKLIYIHIYMFICSELIEETGRPPGLIFGLARTSSSLGKKIHTFDGIMTLLSHF